MADKSRKKEEPFFPPPEPYRPRLADRFDFKLFEFLIKWSKVFGRHTLLSAGLQYEQDRDLRIERKRLNRKSARIVKGEKEAQDKMTMWETATQLKSEPGNEEASDRVIEELLKRLKKRGLRTFMWRQKVMDDYKELRRKRILDEEEKLRDVIRKEIEELRKRRKPRNSKSKERYA